LGFRLGLNEVDFTEVWDFVLVLGAQQSSSNNGWGLGLRFEGWVLGLQSPDFMEAVVLSTKPKPQTKPSPNRYWKLSNNGWGLGLRFEAWGLIQQFPQSLGIEVPSPKTKSQTSVKSTLLSPKPKM